jgi:hypothetical protein
MHGARSPRTVWTMTTGGTEVATTSRRNVEQFLVVALGVMFLPAGLQAAFFPRSFFDDFPLGRSWIAGADPFYGEHLVRDVGALFLAMVVVSLWAWWEPALCLPVAVAWLVQGTLHLVYHVGHLDGLDGVDKVGMLGSLVVVPIIATAVVVLEVRDRARA